MVEHMKVTDKPSEIGFYSGLVVCTCHVVSFRLAPITKFDVLGISLCFCANVFHILLGSFVSPRCFPPSTPLILACDRSDRVGRRPVLFIGLTGSLTSITLFGLSKSLAWAVLARGLGKANHNRALTFLAKCLSLSGCTVWKYRV